MGIGTNPCKKQFTIVGIFFWWDWATFLYFFREFTIAGSIFYYFILEKSQIILLIKGRHPARNGLSLSSKLTLSKQYQACIILLCCYVVQMRSCNFCQERIHIQDNVMQIFFNWNCVTSSDQFEKNICYRKLAEICSCYKYEICLEEASLLDYYVSAFW